MVNEQALEVPEKSGVKQALDARQVGERLNLSPTKTRSLFRKGVLPGHNVSTGKRPTYRIGVDEFERWLAGGKSK
jgi:hypothetical protein